MLSQGLVSNLAMNQLRQASKVQLGQEAITNPAARSSEQGLSEDTAGQ
jgi:hypothetical protein